MSEQGGYRSYATDDLVTGEGVAVEVPAASVAVRAVSGAIDVVLAVVLLFVGLIVLSLMLGGASEAVVGIVVIVYSTAVLIALPAVLEATTRGRTLGKLALGLRVVRDDGGPITARHALMRALVGFVEVYAFFGAPALVASMVNPRAKRLGDMAAGTFVISQRVPLRTAQPPGMPVQLLPWARAADIGTMPAGLTIAIRQFLARAPHLAPESRRALGVGLLHDTLAVVSPPPPPGIHPELVLAAVVAERRRRDEERLRREERLRSRVLPVDPLAPRT